MISNFFNKFNIGKNFTGVNIWLLHFSFQIAIGLAVIFLIIITVSFTQSVRANVAIFYPNTCLGGWENPQNAQGKPDVEFNESASAILKNATAHIFCGGFEGEVPNDSEPKKVLLKMSWALVDKKPLLLDQPVEIPLIIITEETITTIPGEIPPTIITEEATAITTPEEIPFTIITEEAPVTTTVIEEVVTDSSVTIEASSLTMAMEEAPATTTAIEEIPIIVPAEEAPATTTAIEEIPITVPAEEAPATSMTIEEALIVTVTEEIIPSITTETTVLTDDFLEVLYAIDGENWISLGKVNRNNWRGLTFYIPISSAQDLSKIQISIQKVPAIEGQPIVYLDGMWLEVEYGEKELEPEPIQPEAEGALPGPDFSQGTIKQDVRVDNVRALIIEQGGMLELWYGILTPDPEVIDWISLAGDGLIDVASPLIIKERSIFWTDKNKQTMYGFVIDQESLIGEAIRREEVVGAPCLEFQGVSSKWCVSFDLRNDTFVFSQVGLF